MNQNGDALFTTAVFPSRKEYGIIFLRGVELLETILPH